MLYQRILLVPQPLIKSKEAQLRVGRSGEGYNFFMARGWESKSVEQQQDEAVSDRGQRKVQLSAEQIAEERRRQALGLSRKRILQQMEVATNPRHREMLQAALAELERQLQ